ncbi:MAG: DNA-deoxyinosine glycosylase [Pseudomonadota bacterium]
MQPITRSRRKIIADGFDKRPVIGKAGAVVIAKRSFPPVVNPEVRLLVLGSLPGDRSLAAGRYYAHPQNQFWRLMSGVIGRDLVALDYDVRLSALLEAHVGLWDVVASARRDGSSDAAIRDPVGNDLPGLVHSLPYLRAVGFNGATSFRHGAPQLQDMAGKVALIALPSSSPLHTVGVAVKQPLWNQLRDALD